MKGIIYKIYHKDNENLFYIGSTTNYYRRQINHKTRCNNENDVGHNLKLYQIIREHGSWDCFQFDILEELSCETKEELHQIENEYINTLKPVMNCINSVRVVSKEEYQKKYREDNKEKNKKYKKQYYEKNKDIIKKVITCECGCDITKGSILRHKKTKKHLKLIQRTYSHSGLHSH